MSVDLSQFHQVFFEESFEGLDIMESGLLSIQPGSADVELINTVFRAAHSIKGGAGTFGFSMVSDFTHVAETLLDQYRASERAVDQQGIDLLLQSVDVLRGLLSDLQSNRTVDLAEADALKTQFLVLLESGAQSQPEVVGSPVVAATPAVQGWAVYFKPPTDIVQSGNEPHRIFRELAELGEFQITAHTDQVPAFAELDPELIYLAWSIQIKGDVTESQIAELFEWVADDSTLTIEPLNAGSIDSALPALEEPTPESPAVMTPPNTLDSEPVRDKPPATDRKPVANQETQSIRVGIDKIDSLINMVGELVITQSMLGQLGANFTPDKLQKLQEGLLQLEQNTREMQESVMRIRMVPISFTFSRFPRLVRDIAKQLNKNIRLQLLGENTELDKTVMEKIGDPLVHMVRNSLDHGIEMPEKRVAAGKPVEGTLTLNAYHEGGNIVIEIADDGKGIDPNAIRIKAIEKGLIKESDALSEQQLQELIFHPGFSMASTVSDLSGRGVGMDVVKRNIQELKGIVELDSVPGQGTTFKIKLPLTLAILDGQLVRVGEEIFVLPLINIIESVQIQRHQLNTVGGEFDVIVLRNEYVPVIRMYQLFNIEPEFKDITDGLIVVVDVGNRKVGLFIDDLLAQQQVVIKSLDTNYKRIEGVSGATILGDGTVALILDVSGIVELVKGFDLRSSSLQNAG